MRTNGVIRRVAPIAALLAVLATASGHAVPRAPRNVLVFNPRAGHPDTIVDAGLALRLIAQGSDPLENPSGKITHFAYLNDFPPQTIEPSKTEPDENTYLVLHHNPGGPTPGYNYGRRFLFQGHENAGDLAYVTRINLDVEDPAHRITLLTPTGVDGKTYLNRIDGSTYNPHTKSLLFTQENGNVGGVVEIGVEWGSPARTLYGIMGRAGYEGVHPDDEGNILLVEDVGGTSVAGSARNPNSFVYRFVPNDRKNLLEGGKLQALQVSIGGLPLTFVPVDAAHPTGDAYSANQLSLHTPGASWPCTWITIHDTDVTGFIDFDANAAAKAAGATPFKRPENAIFMPGSDFRSFFFTATGDTSLTAGSNPDLAARGSWGSIFRVDLNHRRDSGQISLFVLGDGERAAFDNVAFLDGRTLLAGEDRGDSLHKAMNRLDSIWAFDVTVAGGAPQRIVALGRDTAAEIDAAMLDAATPGFQNDGDNETTGIHVSDGDSTVEGLLGGRLHKHRAARFFFTQQHGLNQVFEVVQAP